MPSKFTWKCCVGWAAALACTLWPILASAQAVARRAPARPTNAIRDDRILIVPKAGHEAALENFHGGQRGRVHRRFPRLGNVQVIAIPKGSDVRTIIERYQKSGHVVVAEPDYLLYVASVPNDPAYLDGTLWQLNNTGQNLGVSDADIDAPEGWDILNSASNIVVAVIDTGVNYTHEDITANMWTNPGEIPDNGIDDDGNGIVDDIHGINAVGDNGNPIDDYGHGAHVAGILGAVGNNGIGVCGVAWRVQIMACKFFDASGSASVSDLIQCLDYARAKGARVINCSFVGGSVLSTSLSDAFLAVRNAGIVVVAAAGNSATDHNVTPVYPASFQMDNIVVVAATTRNDELWSGSDYGATTVHLGAPGVDIWSTWNSSDTAYASDTGTSMSAPVVAGAVALLRAKYPSDTHQQIIARLLAATDPLPSLAGKCVTGGRLNLRKALDGSALPTYSMASAAFNWVPTNGMTFLALGNNSVSAAQPLPFTFHYFTSNYTQLYVGANGLVGFANSSLSSVANGDLPSATSPNALYPYWDDLNPALGGSVWFGTTGQAPNRKAVVSWVGVPYFISSPFTALTFQVILHESGHIAFQYQEVETGNPAVISGQTATIGLEDASGMFAAKYSFNGVPALVTNNQAILFSPSNASHPAPTVTALPVVVPGQFQLRVSAEPARSCVIQVSTNLVNWSPVVTNAIPASGLKIFTDAGAGVSARCFYRASLLP